MKSYPDAQSIRKLQGRPIRIDSHCAQVEREHAGIPDILKDEIQPIAPGIADEWRIPGQCEQAADSAQEFIVEAHNLDI